MNSQELHELILNRRTVHQYLPDAVPGSVIERAIECAIHAPIHRLTFPWRFFWVGAEGRAKLAELHDEFKKKKFLSQGGELLVVTLVRAAKAEIAEEDYASLGCALQNMSLYLWNQGYGTKWATGPVTMSPGVYEVLREGSDPAVREEITPEKLRLCGFFWIGRPAEVPTRPSRPPLENFIRRIR
jgi:nitroreductase